MRTTVFLPLYPDVC